MYKLSIDIFNHFLHAPVILLNFFTFVCRSKSRTGLMVVINLYLTINILFYSILHLNIEIKLLDPLNLIN